MGGSPEVVDYGRFAGRLAAARAATDPGARWNLYREFQAEWGYVPTPWEPEPHEPFILELIGAEPTDDPDGDPGIPAALAEWWIHPYNSAQDRGDLYDVSGDWPPSWRPDPDGNGYTDALPEDSPYAIPGRDRRMCVFLVEAQYCNEWGYLSAESTVDDPKVLVSVSDETWVEQAPSVSEFVLHLAAKRLLPHFGWIAFPDETTPDLVERVRARLPELGLLPWRELGSHSVLHGGPDLIVDIDVAPDGAGDYPLRAFGRTRQALTDLVAELGGQWSVWEPESVQACQERSPRK